MPQIVNHPPSNLSKGKSLCLALTTLINGDVVYISAFTTSTDTYNVTGKLLIPHFTTDPKKAYDYLTEEKANELILHIIDYQGRFYKAAELWI